MTKRSPFIHVPIILIVTLIVWGVSKYMTPEAWHPSYEVGSCVSFVNSSKEEIILKIRAVNINQEVYSSSVENTKRSTDLEFEFSRDLIENYAAPVACPSEEGNIQEETPFEMPESEAFI